MAIDGRGAKVQGKRFQRLATTVQAATMASERNQGAKPEENGMEIDQYMARERQRSRKLVFAQPR
jgi:hypothetical protein